MDYLVDADWLQSNLSDPSLRLFDVTGMLTSNLQNVARERHYNRGHIPGAASLDVASAKGEFTDPNGRYPWAWPQPSSFEALMSRHGVSADTQVVLYAATPRPGVDVGLMWATRAWWIMHHFGVTCAVLDGGWETWISGCRATTTEEPTHAQSRFTAAPSWQIGVVSKEAVLAAIQVPTATCLIDALSRETFAATGKTAYGPRRGHITGAANLPMGELVDANTGLFLDRQSIREKFAATDALTKDSVITYCGGGIAATVDAFALKLIGHNNVAIYDGSLFEWSADPTLPMTVGE